MTSPFPASDPIEHLVAMRDGCRLATDVYGARPASPQPVILERTPYGKRAARSSDQSVRTGPTPDPADSSGFLVGRGYVVVRQDCRGRGSSEGDFVKYLNEGGDGVDTLAWIAEQPWCDGRVLMNGVSYSAHVQTAAAAEGPESLHAMFMDSGGFSSAYEVGMRMGGAFELKQATWAFRHAVRSREAANDPVLAAGLAGLDVADWFHATPWRKDNSPLSLAPAYEDYLLEQWSRETFDDYWSHPAIYARGHYDSFPDIPSFHISSWYDPYIASAIENFTELRRRKTKPAYLLLGPWTHGKRCVSYAGDVDFGAEGYFDGNIASSYLDFRADWFDEVLGRREAPERHAVTYFVMGGGSGTRNDAGRLDHGGHWEHDSNWPPNESTTTRLYLAADGTLAERSPADAGALTYAHDPAHPVPTIGGQVTSGEPVMRGGAYDQRTHPGVFGASEPYLPLSARPDILTFRTPPLDSAVTIAGGVQAEIFVSTSVVDTDLTIKLIDEYPPSPDYPQGFAMNLTEGILRLRFRDSFEEPTPLEPHQVYRVVVTAPDTANLFGVGHRLRMDIASSNFPRFDINPNTGTRVSDERRRIVAETTVHTGGQTPSALVLDLLNGDTGREA